MLTLLKQARAYGLGVVLATQNPVDLDYKGLSNAGTWFIGRLQTQRDKDRVLEGLEGASTAAGHAFDRPEMDKILSALGQRVFVMNNVHDDRPVVFQTRWTLSYLRGPLTREQIQSLMAPRKQATARPAAAPGPAAIPMRRRTVGAVVRVLDRGARLAAAGARPVVPPDVPVFFVPRRARLEPGESILYRPAILGVARLHYADKKAGVDHWETLALLQPVDDAMPAEPWAESEPFDDGVPELDKAPQAGARFAPLPPELARAKCYAEWTKSLKNYLYRERTLRPVELPRGQGDRRGRRRRSGSSGYGWPRRRARSATGRSRRCGPSTRRRCRRWRTRSAAPASGWSASRPRRTSRPGTRRSPWAARSWVRSSAARRSQQDQRDPGRLGRQGRRPGRAAARRRRLGRGLARGLAAASTPSSRPSSGGGGRARRRAPSRGPGARAPADPPQEGGHHRRAGRPGLDAVEGRGPRPAGAGVSRVMERIGPTNRRFASQGPSPRLARRPRLPPATGRRRSSSTRRLSPCQGHKPYS